MTNYEKFQKAFWGLHTDQHAGPRDTVLCRDLTVEHLVERLTQINPDFVQCDCKGHPGYTSWPTEVGVTCPGLMNDNLKIWREATNQLGIPLLMHYSGVVDVKAVEDHPDWGAVNPDGSYAINMGMTSTCLNSPYDDTYMIPQLLEIIDKYDVDGFWLDGENWGVLPCYCDRCRKQFKEEYGIDEPPTERQDPLWAQWADMSRRNFERHLQKITAAVHAHKPGCVVCSNWGYTLRQPEAVNTDVDFLSGDSWNLERTNCEARVMENQGKLWNLMIWGFSKTTPSQLNSTENLCQKAAAIMSKGGAVMVYEGPIRTGVYNEKPFRQMAQVEKFIRARQPYMQGSKLYPQVGVYHSIEELYAANANIYTFGDYSLKPIEGSVNLALGCGYETTILNSGNIEAMCNDFPIIIAPDQDHLSMEKVELLKRYAADGGTLIISGADLCRMFGEEVLGGTFGEIKSFGCLETEDMTVGAPNYIAFTPTTATTIKKLLPHGGLGEWEADVDTAGISKVAYGKGTIFAIFGRFFYDAQRSRIPAYRYILKEILDSVEDDRLVRITAPAYVQPSMRTKDNKLMISFVNIASDYPMLDDDGFCEKVPYAGPIQVRLKLPKKPFNVYNAPSMDPVEYKYKDGVLTAKIDRVHIMDTLVIEQ